MAAAGYLREIMAREPGNARVKALYDGLLEVMEPRRRLLRQEKELATAAKNRLKTDRRAGRDRRQFALGTPGGFDRRSGRERRTGGDRRRR
jgi:hypothetical protein